LIAEWLDLGGGAGETNDVESDKIYQEATGYMEAKVEQVISKDTQAAQVIIQSKAGHEEWPVTARFAVNPASHLGLKKELRNSIEIFDKGIPHDHMDIIMMERSFEGIGIGQEGQQDYDEAENSIIFHNLSRSLIFLQADESQPAVLNFFELEIGLNRPPALK
jgi:hypothetical protein